MTEQTKSGEKVLTHGAGFFRAPLRDGARDGEVIEATGFSLPSEIRYPVNGDNSANEYRYTLRGTSATGYYYEFTGTLIV